MSQVTIMRNSQVRNLRPVPSERPANALRSAQPLLEGVSALTEREIHGVMKLFWSATGQSKCEKFLANRETAQKYGARLEIVGGPERQMKVGVRVEIPTYDSRLDEALEQMVSGMGFKLTYVMVPTDVGTGQAYHRYVRFVNSEEGVKKYVNYERKAKRFYLIEAGNASSDIQNAPSTAENLVRLLRMLYPGVDVEASAQQEQPATAQALPAGVVDIFSARAAREESPPGPKLADQAIVAMKKS